MMICQIEITTYCNAKCFYCPNEFLEHRHISFTLFTEIIDLLPTQSDLLLQGTGEPLLHPQFWEMVEYAKQKNHSISVITNGTIALENRQLQMLKSVGISIDTLCVDTAKKSGRPDPSLIINKLLEYHSSIPEKIKIFAVDYGQELQTLRTFALRHKIILFVQHIQPKSSYQSRYKTNLLTYRNYHCRYIENNIIRYFFVDGKEAPCCFMIDRHKALSRDEVFKYLSSGNVPECCRQCGELTGVSRLSMRSNSKVTI